MFINKKNYFCILSILFVSKLSLAASFPHGCEIRGFGYNNNFLVLNEHGGQTFYLIQNHSNQTIELEHVELKEFFMSPKLRSTIAPANWSAFASDIENTYFKCSVKHEERIETINCESVLEICQYPRVKFALSNMGSYWVSTNKDQPQVIREAVAKGILLRW